METFQHTPATPSALLPTAPMVPAQWVPWKWSSIGSLSSLQKSQPWMSSTNPLLSSSTPASPSCSAVFTHMLGTRSGWV